MKRLGGIWPKLVSFENLLLAYRKARRGKRERPGVAEFGLDLERQLIALQYDLENGEYQPAAYRLFTIYDRKPRVIAAAPFRDRVVHHAVMNLVEPALDQTFVSDSYACRLGKGVHAAIDRYQGWAQTYRYALKMDVHHRRLRNDNGHRFARKLRSLARAYASGRADWTRVNASVQRWIGHARHADTDGLRTRIFSQAVFQRGTGQATASV